LTHQQNPQKGGTLKIPQDLQKSILQRTAKYKSESEKFLLFMRKAPSRCVSERKLLIHVYFNNNPKKIRAAIVKNATLMQINGIQSNKIVAELSELFVFSQRRIREIVK
jgi:hypothetical protein